MDTFSQALMIRWWNGFKGIIIKVMCCNGYDIKLKIYRYKE